MHRDKMPNQTGWTVLATLTLHKEEYFQSKPLPAVSRNPVADNYEGWYFPLYLGDVHNPWELPQKPLPQTLSGSILRVPPAKWPAGHCRPWHSGRLRSSHWRGAYWTPWPRNYGPAAGASAPPDSPGQGIGRLVRSAAILGRSLTHHWKTDHWS